MNPWGRLLDPSAPVPKPSGPSRVHLVAEAYDASAPRPRNREIPAVVPAPAPKPPMTYAEAIAIRERARNRQPVDRMLVLEANQLVQETRRRAMPTRESYGGEQ